MRERLKIGWEFRAMLGVLLLFLGSPSTQAEDVQAFDEWIEVQVGTSTLQETDVPIRRILLTNDTIAEVDPISETQLSIRGIEIGVTDLWIWTEGSKEPRIYTLSVQRDLAEIRRRIDELIRSGRAPRIYPLRDRIVVDGPVDDLETLERIAAITSIYDENFVNLMTVRGDHQVQLAVVFAEVSRSALRELGINALWGDGLLGFGLTGANATTVGGSAYRQELTNYINGGIVPAAATGTFNIFGVVADPLDLSVALSVLEQYNISKILAEPTLVVLSGQQAEFLAGGQIPIPVSQSGSRISIEFKDYGTKLIFVPTVLSGEVIDLRVYVEVSELDSATGTRIVGIEIPGFLSRKGESHLRIENGMTFAMAGLLSESMRSTQAQIPVLGDIPLLGALFRYTQHQRDETELMIFVTPRLVRPMAPEDIPPYPGFLEDNNPNDFEFYLLGRNYVSGSRSYTPAGDAGMQR